MVSEWDGTNTEEAVLPGVADIVKFGGHFAVLMNYYTIENGLKEGIWSYLSGVESPGDAFSTAKGGKSRGCRYDVVHASVIYAQISNHIMHACKPYDSGIKIPRPYPKTSSY